MVAFNKNKLRWATPEAPSGMNKSPESIMINAQAIERSGRADFPKF
jgi:hypothetical protein